ncbi:hypothetical protein WKI68_06090 [Streptomyces sp. MS1.HAVA.3]|uniref:Uncharacterized protein n=1 Tax=Streptomyces caledonius TaxID=3134107 RepID=A0ABU8TZX0_9ACTN
MRVEPDAEEAVDERAQLLQRMRHVLERAELAPPGPTACATRRRSRSPTPPNRRFGPARWHRSNGRSWHNDWSACHRPPLGPPTRRAT